MKNDPQFSSVLATYAGKETWIKFRDLGSEDGGETYVTEYHFGEAGVVRTTFNKKVALAVAGCLISSRFSEADMRLLNDAQLLKTHGIEFKIPIEVRYP